MHYAEDCHLETDEKGVEADGNVSLGDNAGGFNDFCGGEEVEDDHLPEGEEDDEFDAEEF